MQTRTMLFGFDLCAVFVHYLPMRTWFALDFSHDNRPVVSGDQHSVFHWLRALGGKKAASLLAFCVLALLTAAGCRTAPPPEIRTRIETLHVEPVTVETASATPIDQKPLQEPTQETVVPGIPLPEATNAVVIEPSISKTAVAPEQKPTPPPDGPYVALTFDDGPNPKNTPALLDILKARGIVATFFVLGQNAASYPGILERMIAEGHEIGSHGWNHMALTALPAEQRAYQVRKTSEAIERAIGKPPRLIRPPYGATNPDLNRWLMDEQKLKIVLWSVDSRDWEHRDQNSIRREILTATKPGAVILAHDIHHTTVAAMPATLDALLEKGYRFVTVSELIALRGPDKLRSGIVR